MSLNKINFSKDHKLIIDIIIESGKIAIKWFNNKPKVWKKEDGTKVSEADIEVNDFLYKELKNKLPEDIIKQQKKYCIQLLLSFKNML